MGDGKVRLNLVSSDNAALRSSAFLYNSFNSVSVHVLQWDTAGEEKFQAIVPNYFRNAHVILFVYSVMDLRSFQKIGSYWIPFVNRHGPKDTLRVLIGNKCEDKQRRQVPRSVAQVNFIVISLIFVVQYDIEISGNDQSKCRDSVLMREWLSSRRRLSIL